MTGGRSDSSGGRHALPPRRETAERFDSKSRLGRRDEVIEKGQARVRRESRRRVDRELVEASNAGVWTAALFAGVVACLVSFWSVAVASIDSVGAAPDTARPDVFVRVRVCTTLALGMIGVAGALRCAWLIALAPRLRRCCGIHRRRALVLAVSALPFALHVVAVGLEPAGVLVRVSAAAPFLLLAAVALMLAAAGGGRHGTGVGKLAAILWGLVATATLVTPGWLWTILVVEAIAMWLTGRAGTSAWEHFEDAVFGSR